METILFLIIVFNIIQFTNCSYTLPSKNGTFTLSSNIIVNSNISTPVISPQGSMAYLGSQGGWSTTNKYVEYIDICKINQRLSSISLCWSFRGTSCGQQFLDLDSDMKNENYYQTFQLQGGKQYKLSFDWICQVSYMFLSTGINIIWNGNVIDWFYNNDCYLYTSTYYLISINGSNTLSFEGIGLVDSNGILIRNIKLLELIYSSTVNTTGTNTTTTNSSTNYSTATNTSTINSSTTNPPSIYSYLNASTNNNFSRSNITFSSLEDLSKILNGSQYKILKGLITFINNNQLVTLTRYISSLKQNMKFLMGFMLEFNHFLLYGYHFLNYTVTSDIILVSMQLMDEQKGYFLDLYVYPFLNTSPEMINKDFYQQNNLPINQNNIGSNAKFRQSGFLLDITDTLLIVVPVTLIIFFFGYVFFKKCFRFRISLIFRPYSLFGLFFYIILDGKLEILTFQFLCSALLLTASTFQHKMKIIFIIFVYFLCFVFAGCSMYLYRWFYKKLIKYVYDNCKQPLSSTLYMTFSYGLYNIILGFLHRLLLSYPLPQLYALIAFEFAYLIYITSLLFRNFYENKLLAMTLCLMNAARLAFIVTLLVYEMDLVQQQDLSLSQTYIFYSFVVLWGLTSVLCFFDKITLFLKIILIQCKNLRSNKVSSKQNTQLDHKGLQQKDSQKIFIISKNKSNKTIVKFTQQSQYIKQIFPKCIQIVPMNISKHSIKSKKNLPFRQRKKNLVKSSNFLLN